MLKLSGATFFFPSVLKRAIGFYAPRTRAPYDLYEQWCNTTRARKCTRLSLIVDDITRSRDANMPVFLSPRPAVSFARSLTSCHRGTRCPFCLYSGLDLHGHCTGIVSFLSAFDTPTIRSLVAIFFILVRNRPTWRKIVAKEAQFRYS